jgi:diguanylate cyclase (GGDEF)-like protein
MPRQDSHQDSRLLELRYLSDLSRQPWTLWSPSTAAAYDAEAEVFRDMVLHLLMQECIQGNLNPPTVGTVLTAPPPPQSELWWRLRMTIIEVMNQRPCMLGITHTGRIRLSRLLDEMDRRRIRDSFGILLDGRHFEQDLRMRIWLLDAGAPLTVAEMDLDHFKAVNDTFGHLKGDEVIKRYLELARSLAGASGGEAYRLGGDEVWIVFPNMVEEMAKATGEHLRKAVEAEFADLKMMVRSRTVESRITARLSNVFGLLKARSGLASIEQPTASIGIVTFSRPGALSNEQIRQSVDKRAYEAKERGRNRVVHAHEQ